MPENCKAVATLKAYAGAPDCLTTGGMDCSGATRIQPSASEAGCIPGTYLGLSAQQAWEVPEAPVMLDKLLQDPPLLTTPDEKEKLLPLTDAAQLLPPPLLALRSWRCFLLCLLPLALWLLR